MSPDPLDLHHLGRERVIGSYLLETEDGPALFDCGPSTCVDRLQEELAGRGLQLRDVRLLLAGQTLSMFGDWAMIIVLGIWAKVLTGSNAQAGLVFFVFALAGLIAPIGGLVVDRLTVTHGTCRGAWIRRGQGPGVVRLSMSDAWCNILYA